MARGWRGRVHPAFTQGFRDPRELPQRRGIAAPVGCTPGTGEGTRLAPGLGMSLWFFSGLARIRVARGVVAAVWVASVPSAHAAPRLWEPPSEVVGLRDASAVAVDPESRRVAVGDRGGVRLFLPGVAAERVLRRGPVHDLAFGEAGVLFAATARGLFRISPSGEAVRIGLGPAGPESIQRLAVAHAWVAAAGAGGLFVAADGKRFVRVAGGIAREGVAAVGLAAPAEANGPPELWWVAQGALFWGQIEEGDPPRVVGVDRVALPPGDLARDAHDLVLPRRDSPAVVVAERHVALLGGRRFQRLSPTWPAGARAVRVLATEEGIWIATDRGLVFGEGWQGPWRRAAPPAGAGAVAALAAGPGGIWLAGSRGLLRGRVQGSQPSASGEIFAARLRSEPTIQEVHAAVVRHQGLSGRRMRDLARGVRRRGWLPDVTVRGGYGDFQRARIDRDQVVFSSGVLHDLRDTQSDHDRDWEASLAFTWELGDVLYHPESIDVSKESREWVELRDEVLDEVNQLYFERHRVLLELAGSPAPSADAARQRLRADELAAGLDAWTGGWFGFRAPPLSGPGSVPSSRQPQENSP